MIEHKIILGVSLIIIGFYLVSILIKIQVKDTCKQIRQILENK